MRVEEELSKVRLGLALLAVVLVPSTSWALIVGRVAPLPLLAFALESLQLHKFWEKAKSFSCMALTL